MRNFWLSVFLTFGSLAAYATHNRAGEIIYRHIGGNTYEFTVFTYTKVDAPADRPTLPISWGDGSPMDTLERSDIFEFSGRNTQRNTYIEIHTFPGAGSYDICISDPNRNAGIININSGSSVVVEFAIRTTLRISAAIAPNSSIIFANIPLQDACLFQPWVHNPGAVDQDGTDSISYKLVPSMGFGCVSFELGFYQYPNELAALGPSPNPNTNLSIDPFTGTITWDSPQRLGEYNLAFTVEEWRSGILISTVLRDMQITVENCPGNVPPVLSALIDTCVEAGDVLTLPITATDNNSSNVAITGFGGPFSVGSSPATIAQSDFVPTAVATFNWATDCSHIRLAPYQTNIQATDNGPGTSLVDVNTFRITVVAPAPQDLQADAVGSSIQLSWFPSPCAGAVGYKIYRRINFYGFLPSQCETGVPAYTGYSLITTLEGEGNTNYLDQDEVIFGRQNCYMVVACFPDRAQSYASNETCAEILFEIPIIKKNSIGLTATVGIDTVEWRSPIELDMAVFPGPYQYKLYRGDGLAVPDEEVLVSSIETELSNLPTQFISSTLNTEESAHTYRVELFSNGEFAAKSNRASSLFLELEPNDNQVTISFTEQLPWINFQYDIYRQDNGAGSFELLATTDAIPYTDLGLVNNRIYCYYVVSHGSYFAVLENDTLINFSQRSCTIPYDRTPPCAPVLTGEEDCVALEIDLEWSNPNDTCDETDDTMLYNVYFAPTNADSLTLLQTVQGDFNTAIQLIFDNSIAGCYAVTALDSLSLWPDGTTRRNESDFSNVLCFDNCPEYELPNVFTPNGDGRNDIFRPFPYRSIESVEFTVFNRWGVIVYQSTDPDLQWSGTDSETDKIVSDGVYFYTCRVFSIRLSGLVPIDLAGYVTVFGGNSNPVD